VANSLAYFGDEAPMRAASVPRILDDGEAQELPPLLVVQPGEDQNVPLEMTQYLMRSYQRRESRPRSRTKPPTRPRIAWR
jgi:hypothetical protein